jgi:RNA polymerase sigma factor (sigma-70 family)
MTNISLSIVLAETSNQHNDSSNGEKLLEIVNRLCQEPNLIKTALNIARQNGLKLEDAEDAVQDAYLIFHRCLTEGRFNGSCSLRHYFLSIVKWHTLGRARKRKYQVVEFVPETHSMSYGDLAIDLLAAEQRQLLKQAMDGIGIKRSRILEWTQSGYTMKEIAKKGGYKSDNVAKKEAWISRQHLKRFILEQPFYREQLRYAV